MNRWETGNNEQREKSHSQAEAARRPKLFRIGCQALKIHKDMCKKS
jgi:hypothetical protein